jgi:hypothetical protein
MMLPKKKSYSQLLRKIPRDPDMGRVCTCIWRRDRTREGISAVKHPVKVIGRIIPQVVYRFIF